MLGAVHKLLTGNELMAKRGREQGQLDGAAHCHVVLQGCTVSRHVLEVRSAHSATEVLVVR